MQTNAALSQLNIPRTAIPALLLLISELQKCDTDFSTTSHFHDASNGHYTRRWPNGFRPNMAEKIIDFGSDFFGSRRDIPAKVFCTLMGGSRLFDLRGFDVEYQQIRLESIGQHTRDLSPLHAINDAIALAKQSDELSGQKQAAPIGELSRSERFVFLFNKFDDLIDFEDIITNFPEMLQEPHTRRLYSHSIAPLTRLTLEGDTKLERAFLNLLESIEAGYDKHGPKATVIKFRPKAPKN